MQLAIVVGHGRVPGGPFVGCQRARERLGQWRGQRPSAAWWPPGPRSGVERVMQVWPERAVELESGDLGDEGGLWSGRLDEQECEGQCGWHEDQTPGHR